MRVILVLKVFEVLTLTFDGSHFDTLPRVDLSYTAMELWSVGTTAQSTGANANTHIADIAFIENIRGSNFADTLNGDAGNNRIEGGLGYNTLFDRTGNDSFVFTFRAINNQRAR
jgi:Ca2+-binding RTX toxin-like protein